MPGVKFDEEINKATVFFLKIIQYVSQQNIISYLFLVTMVSDYYSIIPIDNCIGTRLRRGNVQKGQGLSFKRSLPIRAVRFNQVV
jgi:hypothetical protein